MPDPEPAVYFAAALRARRHHPAACTRHRAHARRQPGGRHHLELSAPGSAGRGSTSLPGASRISAVVLARARKVFRARCEGGVGAAYCNCRSIRTIQSAAHFTATSTAAVGRGGVSRRQLLVEAAIGRTAAFFLAFIPQFVNQPGATSALQFVVLGFLSVVALNTLANMRQDHLRSRRRPGQRPPHAQALHQKDLHKGVGSRDSAMRRRLDAGEACCVGVESSAYGLRARPWRGDVGPALVHARAEHHGPVQPKKCPVRCMWSKSKLHGVVADAPQRPNDLDVALAHTVLWPRPGLPLREGLATAGTGREVRKPSQVSVEGDAQAALLLASRGCSVGQRFRVSSFGSIQPLKSPCEKRRAALSTTAWQALTLAA